MITGFGHWTLGMYIGLPIVIVIGLLSILVTGFGIVMMAHDDNDGMIVAFLAGVVALFMLGIGLVGYYPYKTDYHRYSVVEGTVAETNSRLISNDDKGVSQRIVIRFNESDQLFGCDDTRCALATTGKHVRLNCIKEYQWNAQAGWACKYGQVD